MKMYKTIFVSVLVTLALVYGGIAEANVITGDLWHVPEATAQNAVPGNVPGTTPNVTFDVNSPLNFDNPTQDTVQNWLNSGGAFNIIENIAGTLASLMDNGTIGTLVQFIGSVSVTNGQMFSVAHDDGLTLTIGGLTVVNVPGPTPPTVTTVTYTGPTGNFPFQLVYGECCGGPSVLQVDLPLSAAVPEPATMLLLGSGLLGLAGYGRKKFFKK